MKNVNWLDHLFNFISVILGVSLAFFVNDYSASKKSSAEKKYYISSIYTEIKEDIDVYTNYQIPVNEMQIESIDKAIASISTGENVDSLLLFISEGIAVDNYFPNNNIFRSLQNAGKIDVIEDFKLRGKLLYYILNSEEAKFRGKGQLDFYMDRVLPWYLANANLFDDPALLLNRIDLLTYLDLYKGFIMNKLDKYRELVEDGQEILKYMDENQSSYLAKS